MGGGEGAVASQSESGLDGEGCGGDQGPRPQGWGSSTRSLRPLSDVCGVLERRGPRRRSHWEASEGVVAGTRSRRGDKSSEPRLNLSGSWQQGHSAAYNTPFLIQVVCKGFIARGQEIVVAHGSCDTAARGFPRAVDRFPSGMDSNLEAFSYNPAHGSFAASPFPAAAIPMVRIGGSSRTEPNYRRKTDSSRVKLTCLTTV